jgi:hypothetical protein
LLLLLLLRLLLYGRRRMVLRMLHMLLLLLLRLLRLLLLLLLVRVLWLGRRLGWLRGVCSIIHRLVAPSHVGLLSGRIGRLTVPAGMVSKCACRRRLLMLRRLLLQRRHRCRLQRTPCLNVVRRPLLFHYRREGKLRREAPGQRSTRENDNRRTRRVVQVSQAKRRRGGKMGWEF